MTKLGIEENNLVRFKAKLDARRRLTVPAEKKDVIKENSEVFVWMLPLSKK